jgi:hypothetical protein
MRHRYAVPNFTPGRNAPFQKTKAPSNPSKLPPKRKVPPPGGRNTSVKKLV